jgi:hypothetical protein
MKPIPNIIRHLDTAQLNQSKNLNLTQLELELECPGNGLNHPPTTHPIHETVDTFKASTNTCKI